jgi:CHAT domain-containing protein/tetratricopeptide (TPR) repeat protein
MHILFSERVFMRRLLSLFSIAVLIMLFELATALAQQNDLNAVLKRSQVALKRSQELGAEGNYPAALVEARNFESLIRLGYGADHPNYAIALGNVASLYIVLGNLTEAEALYQRALAIREAKLGNGHLHVAVTLSGLAAVYDAQGKYAEAEIHTKRALAIREAKLPKDSPDIAHSLLNLALLYVKQGKYAESEAHFKRALAIYQAKLGRDDPSIATVLNGLVSLYQEQGKYDEAEAPGKRALAIYQARFGNEHPDVARTLTNLANVHEGQGRYAEAEAYHKRAHVILAATFGKDHPDVAISNHNLANVYDRQGKYAEAEVLHRNALTGFEAKLDHSHPHVAETANKLAVIYGKQGKHAEALALVRKASAAVIAHARVNAAGPDHRGGDKSPTQRARYFRDHVAILFAAGRQGTEAETALARESFEVAQWAGQSSAAAALAQMAARQMKGTGALAQLVRERQDLEWQWRATDARLDDAVAKGDATLVATLRNELSVLNGKFEAIDTRLARDFPDYASLSNPKPLSVAEAQALLAPAEALFLTTDTADASFAWLLTKKEIRWAKLALTPQAIADKVQALRCGLDYDGEWGAVDKRRAERCLNLLKLNSAPAGSDAQPFDLAVAHEIYEVLFGSFKDMVQDRELLIVPTGALASLPFQVLVTEKPATAVPPDADYRGVRWLGLRHANTVLPSVVSLKSLREHAKASAAAKPYIGFGNPLITGPNGTDHRASQIQNCPAAPPGAIRSAARSSLGGDVTKVMRGGLADLVLLRQQQPLPETADELCDVGRNLAASPSDILLGARATELSIKTLSAKGALANYRVLHFATHGLLPHETASVATGLTEAALLFTPPDRATEEDDGLLTASEVALLKLNADWVIMSACNTGGGDKSGEALSGLARAFFYAGTRALLVSHWYVDSAAAVALTSKIFDEMNRDSKLGRAEALRRSMQALIAQGGRSSHPANWAPFVVVGEGAAR